jgi:dTDP-4-dehydrorhamnose 3,5-epimerase
MEKPIVSPRDRELPSNEQGFLEGAVWSEQSVTPHWEHVRELVHGVKVKEVKHVPTHYGSLRELYRADWLVDDEPVGGVFASTLEPGAISAWHAHVRTHDRLFVVDGMLRIVLYDARTSSPTHRMLNADLLFGHLRPALLVIPPGVWHGVQNVSSRPALLVNVVSRAYTYDEPDHLRLPPDSDQIPYRGFA